jgi:competence protein ComEC
MKLTRQSLGILLTLFFILVFWLRVNQVGGLKPNAYKFNSATLGERPEVFSSLNQYLTDTVNKIEPSPESALLAGIILGAKQELPPDFKQALTRTSTIHIVVVSGENLSLLSSFIMVLAPYFGRKKTIALNILAVLGFTLLTGLQVPVLRAAFMVLLSYSAQILGKEGDSAWVLFLTGMLMLLINPNWLFSISFQLSFLATAGVLLLAPLLMKKLRFLPNIIKQDLAVTLAAQALTWPIIAANFAQISLTGLLANALVLWTVPLIELTGIFTLFLGILNLKLGSLVGLIPAVFLRYFVIVINFIGSFSFAQIDSVSLPVIMAVGYYLILTGLYFFLKKETERQVVME